jgi:peptidyl-prolyl cis-trans isomerase C
MPNRKSLATLGLSFALCAIPLTPVLAADPPAAPAAAPTAPAAAPAPAVDLGPPDPIALVNGAPIPLALYKAYASQRQAQLGDASPAEVRQQLTNELVLQELLVQEANKVKLESDPQFIQQLELVKRNLLASLLVRRMVGQQKPTEEAIKQEYDKARAGMDSKEYKLSHILVDSEDKAKSLIADLKKGGDFAALAKANSSDSSAAEGGDLDWVDLGLLDPPFGEAVRKLEKGKFAEQPVQTRFGWHVIKLDDVRENQPPSLDELRPQIARSLESRAVSTYLNQLREGAKVEVK